MAVAVASSTGCAARLTDAVDTTLPDLNPLPPRTAVELVEEAATDPDPAVRGVALSALVGTARADLPRWVMQGSYDPEPWVQRAVVRELIRRLAEPEVVEHAVEYVLRASGDPYVRVEVAAALLGAGHGDRLGPLVGAWRGQPAWRAAPLALLAAWAGDPSARGAMAAAVATSDVRDDRSFVVAMGRTGWTELEPALGQAVERLPELSLRFSFTAALLGSTGGAEAWARAQRTEFSAPREAIELVMLLPPEERARWLRSVATLGDASVKAARSIVGRPAPDRLRRALRTGDPWLRHVAVTIAGELAKDQATEIIAAGLVDDFDEVRVGAAALAGRFDAEAARPQLTVMLVEDHRIVRVAAAGALLRMDAAVDPGAAAR